MIFSLNSIASNTKLKFVEIVIRVKSRLRPSTKDFVQFKVCETNLLQCRPIYHESRDQYKRHKHRILFDRYNLTKALITDHVITPGSDWFLVVTINQSNVTKQLHTPQNWLDVLLVGYNRLPHEFQNGGSGFESRTKRQTPSSVMTGSVADRLKNVSDNEEDSREICALHQWYLNFTRLGWTSWVQFPNGYFANYCEGSCLNGATADQNASMTNHAYVRNLYNLALQRNGEPGVNSPAVCCVPIRFSSINILYRNDANEWVMREMKEMIAERCGCL